MEQSSRVSNRRTFLAGFATFGVASLGCAVVPTIGVFVAMRAMQGFGASMRCIIPSGIGIAVPAMTSALLGATPRERSGLASGVLNTVRQAAAAFGAGIAAALIARMGVVDAVHLPTGLWLIALAAATAITTLGIARTPRTRRVT